MPGRKKTDVEYFTEGQNAYRDGKPVGANPYDDTNAAAQWQSGWECEDEAAHGRGR